MPGGVVVVFANRTKFKNDYNNWDSPSFFFPRHFAESIWFEIATSP